MPEVYSAPKGASPHQKTHKTHTGHQGVSKHKELPHEDVHNLPGHSHNPLSAYCYFPDKVKFIATDPEEKIVLLLRKHPITNLRWLIIAFFMTLAPLLVTFVSPLTFLPVAYQLIALLLCAKEKEN